MSATATTTTGRSRQARPADALSVLVVTESTYPFYWGGLSTWCHALVKELSDVDFSLLAISADPFPQVRFDLPENVVDFRALPLWGIRSAWEIDSQLTRREARRRVRRTNAKAIEESFIPLYRTLLGQLLGDERNDELFASTLHQIYRFFRSHDFDVAFRSERAWEVFCEDVEKRYPQIAEAIGYVAEPLTTRELLDGWQWLYHWLFPLSQTLPKTDIAHATMAGTCAVVSLVCKLEHGAGFLLSEHGIYLREIYLAEHNDASSLFGKLLKLGSARRVTEVSYEYADAIAPCCDYNQRWERRVGADQKRLWTAYYGIDSAAYARPEAPPRDAPVVVWAGRIDPLKDVETLLHAAAFVKETRPDVRFRLFGAASIDNRGYLERCTQLHETLGLGDAVVFEGFTSDIPGAFAAGDVVLLTSISEGFPFSTLEAMACGKPVVATAVGGIAEQITPDCGRIVRPRDGAALGQALLEVLEDETKRAALAAAARVRAESLFGIDRFVSTRRAIYEFVLASRELRAGKTAEALDAELVKTAREVSLALNGVGEPNGAHREDGAEPDQTELVRLSRAAHEGGAALVLLGRLWSVSSPPVCRIPSR